jgi:hypothetical protein
MPNGENATILSGPIQAVEQARAPLVFISHDSRDALLAEAFEKLLKSVSAGMIKTFRSTDKTPGKGIDFGDEWYKRLIDKLLVTSDVVCLFTERSLQRPWLLFEAGVAKGQIETPVIGLALGIPLARVAEGPFYQFQNMEDSEGDLSKLVYQLAKRVPALELDQDVVSAQVRSFRDSVAGVNKAIAGEVGEAGNKEPEESSYARLTEEMKALPGRIVERLSDASEIPSTKLQGKRTSDSLRQMYEMAEEFGDPTPILLWASLVRSELPWLYEIVSEACRVEKIASAASIEKELGRLSKYFDYMLYLHRDVLSQRHRLGPIEALPDVLFGTIYRSVRSRKRSPRLTKIEVAPVKKAPRAG